MMTPRRVRRQDQNYSLPTSKSGIRSPQDLPVDSLRKPTRGSPSHPGQCRGLER